MNDAVERIIADLGAKAGYHKPTVKQQRAKDRLSVRKHGDASQVGVLVPEPNGAPDFKPDWPTETAIRGGDEWLAHMFLAWYGGDLRWWRGYFWTCHSGRWEPLLHLYNLRADLHDLLVSLGEIRYPTRIERVLLELTKVCGVEESTK